MEDIYIMGQSGLTLTPTVNFNSRTGVCEIAGESHLPESRAFYEPLFKWLRSYSASGKPITLNIKLVYFSTSTSKCLLEIFKILKHYQNSGGDVSINWYLERDDEGMEEEVEDFAVNLGLNIKTIYR